MESARFHNALRILRGLGANELKQAGVIDENWGTVGVSSDRDQITDFLLDPFREAFRMPDANYERLFALIESRQSKRSPSAFDLLCECFDAFDGEEESVKEEHAELIEKVRSYLDQHRPAPPLADRCDGGTTIVHKHTNIMGSRDAGKNGEVA